MYDVSSRLLRFCSVGLLAACVGAGNHGSGPVRLAQASGDAPRTIGRKHVDTADYWLNTKNQAQYAPYLTYEYPHSGYAAAAKAAGIKTVAYINVGMPRMASSLPETAVANGPYSSAMAKSCGGGTIAAHRGNEYVFDPHDRNATAFLQASVDAHVRQWAPDAIFFDNWNDLYGTSDRPCDFSSYDEWTGAAIRAVASIDTHGAELFVNTLSVPSAYRMRPSGLTVENQVAGLRAPNVTGGQYEACYVNRAAAWIDAESAELLTIAAHRTFWCYANGALTRQSADSPAALAQRMFAYASFLLTYDPNHSIYQTWAQTPSGFKVMPETQFVPLSPLAHPSSISNLSAGGAYVRTYNACYYAGTLVGACEIAVNPSSSTVPVPNASRYRASAQLQGSDILDGGTMTFGGGVPSSLGPQSAAILVR